MFPCNIYKGGGGAIIRDFNLFLPLKTTTFAWMWGRGSCPHKHVNRDKDLILDFLAWWMWDSVGRQEVLSESGSSLLHMGCPLNLLLLTCMSIRYSFTKKDT